MMNRVAGVVLAGGLSSRFGSDKAFAQFHGLTMISYAIQEIIMACEKIVISGEASKYGKWGYKCIPDNFKHAGPLGGVEATMTYLVGENYTHVLVSTCDMPLIDSHLLRKLINQDADSSQGVCYENQPFPCLLPTECLPEVRGILKSQGRHSMKQLFANLKMIKLLIEDVETIKFANANTFEDLRKINMMTNNIMI